MTGIQPRGIRSRQHSQPHKATWASGPAKPNGQARAMNRVGTKDKKLAPPERQTGRLTEPAACNRCGAIFSHRTWRRDHRVTAALLDQVAWTECPACKQTREGEYWGRVLIRGSYAVEHEQAIRERIQNVEARAKVTQPERRVVSADSDGNGLEVLTTSQKLAHRIVHELKKAFRGRARYQWSDDGSLFAVWQRN